MPLSCQPSSLPPSFLDQRGRDLGVWDVAEYRSVLSEAMVPGFLYNLPGHPEQNSVAPGSLVTLILGDVLGMTGLQIQPALYSVRPDMSAWVKGLSQLSLVLGPPPAHLNPSGNLPQVPSLASDTTESSLWILGIFAWRWAHAVSWVLHWSIETRIPCVLTSCALTSGIYTHTWPLPPRVEKEQLGSQCDLSWFSHFLSLWMGIRRWVGGTSICFAPWEN